MNFGGPVWHASGRGWSVEQSRSIAERALQGAGDGLRGEWHEEGNGGVFHVRRRLSAEEQAVVGEARDIRGTPAEAQRWKELLAAVGPLTRAMLLSLRIEEASTASAPKEPPEPTPDPEAQRG